MMLTAEDFEKLGFWEDETPEENITVYGKDFSNGYLLLTDELGKTPLDDKEIIVAAFYDESDAFLWSVEIKNFSDFKAICKNNTSDADFLTALRNYRYM